jgi:hypothetical protein
MCQAFSSGTTVRLVLGNRNSALGASDEGIASPKTRLDKRRSARATGTVSRIWRSSFAVAVEALKCRTHSCRLRANGCCSVQVDQERAADPVHAHPPSRCYVARSVGMATPYKGSLSPDEPLAPLSGSVDAPCNDVRRTAAKRSEPTFDQHSTASRAHYRPDKLTLQRFPRLPGPAARLKGFVPPALQ